jgi:hypothetical protein
MPSVSRVTYIASSDGRMTDEKLDVKDLEGSGRGLIAVPA